MTKLQENNMPPQSAVQSLRWLSAREGYSVAFSDTGISEAVRLLAKASGDFQRRPIR
jgi:hypothetical protein